MIDLSDSKTAFTVWRIEWLLVFKSLFCLSDNFFVEVTLSMHPLFRVPYPIKAVCQRF